MSVTALVPSSNSSTSPTTSHTKVLANALAVKASLGVLYGVSGYSTAAQFLQFHDKATAPSAAAVPLLSIPIAANTAFNVDMGVYGLFFALGIQIVNSTTGPTYTAGAADTYITARYE